MDRWTSKTKSNLYNFNFSIGRGADPRAVNREGKTSLELALESNFADSEVLAILSDSNG